MLQSVSLLLLLQSFFLTANCKLYQVYSLARHGARFHVLDLYDSNSTKAYEGQLTAVGMRQQQKFGELLRKEYIEALKFLSFNYKKQEIQVLSTHTNRTTQSIQSFLYGLYPPYTGNRIPKVSPSLYNPPYNNQQTQQQTMYALPYGYQPIKVNNTEITVSYDCANYQAFAQQNFNKTYKNVSEMNEYYFDFIQRMSRAFGFKLTNELDNLLYLTRVFDVANVDRHLGRPLPADFTDQDLKNAKHFGNWYFFNQAGGKNALVNNKIKFGKIFKEFDNRINDVNGYPLKWTFVSGHDFDLLTMHLAMKTGSAQCTEQLFRTGSTTAVQCQQGSIDFVGSLIIQLHSQDQKNYYVKVRSQGKYLKICSRGLLQCDYKQFKQLVSQSMTNQDINKLCGNETPHFVTRRKKREKVMKDERR